MESKGGSDGGGEGFLLRVGVGRDLSVGGSGVYVWVVVEGNWTRVVREGICQWEGEGFICGWWWRGLG